ncbi:uncharacterized protein LAJ45_03259 [Morchella importuna]|uniref:uncharacterized protein n=1 Tax=Morchella importuna TaxID=1174673 RepID=UPI001E8CACFC|nr:uncharacterized protein LAJ45_03259 [Morchella importuna]KAH8152419.1 hypothetical protein LAJ45_03259 [Morchella importuna]
MAPSVASLIQSFSPKSPVAEQLPVDGSAVPKTDENDKAHEVDKDEAETLPGEVSSADTSSSDVSIPSTDENTVVTFAEVRRKEFLSRFHAYVEGMTFPDDPAGPGGINHPSKLPYSWDDEVEFIQELQDGQEIPDGLTGNAAKREWLSMLWRHHKDQPYLGSRWSDTTEETSEEEDGDGSDGIMGVAEVMMMTRG